MYKIFSFYWSLNANLNAWHGTCDIEVLPVPAPRLHEGDTVAATHVLCRVLTHGYVHGRDYVGRVRIETTCKIIK